jgi:RNA polymerase sigma factor (sigma-70 family)
VFERYYRELLNFIARKVSDRALAADLTQESYARVYAAQNSGTSIEAPRALLYKTARNLMIDHHRRADVRAEVEIAQEDGEPPESFGPRPWEPEAAAVSSQGVQALVAIIDNLPPRCRQAFMLNRFEAMSYTQVAENMGISVKAVEQHIKLALKACEAHGRSSEASGDQP